MSEYKEDVDWIVEFCDRLTANPVTPKYVKPMDITRPEFELQDYTVRKVTLPVEVKVAKALALEVNTNGNVSESFPPTQAGEVDARTEGSYKKVLNATFRTVAKYRSGFRTMG